VNSDRDSPFERKDRVLRIACTFSVVAIILAVETASAEAEIKSRRPPTAAQKPIGAYPAAAPPKLRKPPKTAQNPVDAYRGATRARVNSDEHSRIKVEHGVRVEQSKPLVAPAARQGTSTR